MRCYCLVLFITAALFASDTAAGTAPDSGLSIRGQVDIRRALRAHTKPTNNEEERGWFSSVPKLLLSDNEINQLVKEAASIDDVFTKLQLHQLVKVDKLEKVDNGLSQVLINPNLIQFGNFLVKSKKENPAEAMITALTQQYGDIPVAKMLFDAKRKYGGETKEVAEKLQAEQFIKWFDNKQTMRNVWDRFELTHATSYTNRYHDIWWDYLAAYVPLSIKRNQPIPFEI
ncbi:Secreted RxLR effector peptide protein [Phytophthora palmivora]|uniref:RxLR effector protein n=1 Tax=Phytophthora palmivora TaxID=4796 RepID=A0A2P4XYE8_9STRA|nr:Secreted RxLR effector peptide protein [Phytophthora palmivora]